MRILSILFLCLILLPLRAQELKEIKEFGKNEGNLTMFVHEPVAKAEGSKMKVLLVLHGCNQGAEATARKTGWNKIADHFGFMVIYAEQRMLNNPNKCFNWFNKKDMYKGKGETASLYEMLRYSMQHYDIDTTQLYVYGMSAGAAMSTALLANYPSTFRAGAILAGGAFVPSADGLDGLKSMLSPTYHKAKDLKQMVRDQNPNYKGAYPNLVVVHGQEDVVVNIKNSYQLIRQWTALHDCDTIADEVVKNFAQTKEVTKSFYTDSRGHNAVIYYEVENLGHAILIHPGEKMNEGGESGLFTTDKNFHSTWYIAKDLGLVPEDFSVK